METIQSINDMVRPGVMLAGVIAFVLILFFVLRHLDSWPVWRTGPLTAAGGLGLLASFKAGFHNTAVWTLMTAVCVAAAVTIAIASSVAHRKISRQRHVHG